MLISIRGALLILCGVFLSFFMTVGRLFGGHRPGMMFGGLFLLLAGVFDVYAGTMIRRVSANGRTLGIIVCILALFSFPFGTALGIYGLWFLFSDGGKSLYQGTGIGPIDFDRPQPPPNSWA
ncbi:MAG: hypothetical protein JO053_07910 [Acidobacteria bacterium]|nr:hypothetical protein [Acidobacteriota bacterium]